MAAISFSFFFIFSFSFFFFLSLSETTMSPTDIFVLGGQSNMAGRGGVFMNATTSHNQWDGFIPMESQSNNSTLRFNNNSNWELSREPLHRDIDRNKINGFCKPPLAQGRRVVGLVPCAIGGTYLREWVKGTVNYTKLVDRINASEQYGGKVRAFFWLQGESDALVRLDAEFYQANLTKFFTDLRADLQHPQLPIILVKIVNWDTKVSPIINYTDDIRRAEEAVGDKLPKIGLVDARTAIRQARSQNKTFLNRDGNMSVYSEVEMGKILAEAYLKYFV